MEKVHSSQKKVKSDIIEKTKIALVRHLSAN